MAGGGSPKQTSTLSAAQNRVSRSVAPQIREGVANGVQGYKGDIVAPLDPKLSSLYNSIPTLGQVGQNDGSTNSAIQNLLSGKPAYNLDPQTTTDYFNKSVLTPMMATYNQQIKPQIQQAFAASGRSFSAAKGNALSRSLTDLGVGAQAQLAQGIFQNQSLEAQLAQNAVNNQIQGIGLSQQQSMMPYNRISALQGVLQPYQQQHQAVANANYNQWQMQQPYNNPWLAQAQSFLGNSQVAMYNPTNPMGAAATGALGGAAVGATFGPVGAGVGAVGGAAAGYLSASR